MILRRVIEHVRIQNWFAVALDFIIVVVGVFIGIQVANWNDAGKDRTEEAIFLKALYQDVLELEKNSTQLVKLRIEGLNAIGTASDILLGKAEWRDLTEVECDAISTSDSPGIIATSLPSWTALRDAGRTNIVTNIELRRGLATLTQKRESLDRIMGIAELQGYDLLSEHPDLFKVRPIKTELKESPARIHYLSQPTCDAEALSQNQAAMNGLAGNMNRYSAVVNRFGIVPWVEQVTEIRMILERDFKEEAGN